MIRLIGLTLGLVTAGFAVLWSMGGPITPTDDEIQQVSRSEPSILTLQPALTQPALAQTEPVQVEVTQVEEVVVAPAPSEPVTTVPVSNTVDQSAIVAALAAATQVKPEPKEEPSVAEATLGIEDTDDEVMKALRAMSLGIVQELQKPKGWAVAAPEPVKTAVATRTYDVKQGDSLPGISFRFYGTTVGYLQILEANKDILPHPSDLQAGMTLRIPDLN
ncbi:MAG: LysM peptidoglycan-binding domain-containing protein [Pelagimonas sp.]